MIYVNHRLTRPVAWIRDTISPRDSISGPGKFLISVTPGGIFSLVDTSLVPFTSIVEWELAFWWVVLVVLFITISSMCCLACLWKIEDQASVFISALFWIWKSLGSFSPINKMKGLIPKWFTPHVFTNYLVLLNHSNNLSRSFNISTFMEVVCFIITLTLFIVGWNVNLRNVSRKYLLECIKSLQHYELTRRYNLLPLKLASPAYAETDF